VDALRDYVETPARQAAALRETSHRPWPVPERSWLQGQTWDDLLFAHWRVPEEALRKLVPAQLPLDTFDGSAWIGVTPFKVSGVRLRGTLPVPFLSTYLELNTRTYVTLDGKPGVYFFSLDAESPLVVEGARRTYRLPYYRARMSARRRGDWIDFASARREGAARPHVLEASYRPSGGVFEAKRGTLDYFLAERYCLYTLDEREDVCRADIHHPPWPLQSAEAVVSLNTMGPDGIELSEEPDVLHFSARQDVVVWSLDRVEPAPS
jgi:uncharacterized protein